MEEVIGSGLRAEVVEGDDDPLLLDNDPLDVTFDNDPELGLDVLDLDDDPELMSTSSTSNVAASPASPNSLHFKDRSPVDLIFGDTSEAQKLLEECATLDAHERELS